MLGEEMSKNQCTKDTTVRNVKRYLTGFDMDSRYAIHQFLEWFALDRKLERIVWATLKKSEVVRRKEAESLKEEQAEIAIATEQGKPYHPKPERISNEPPLTVIVGVCPRCKSMMKGMATGTCSKGAGNFGVMTFYKECGACTYYSQIFKKRNKYREVEGG
jgi:hypothetical protein